MWLGDYRAEDYRVVTVGVNPPPSSRPAGKAGRPSDVITAVAAVSQTCTTEFSTHHCDVKKKKRN